VLARSTASADRPFVGRSAAAVVGLLVALIASLAIGAAAARAGADSPVAEQASETDQSATATASPPAAGAPAAPAQSTAQTEPPAPAGPSASAESSAPAEPSTPAEQESAPVADEPAEPASPPAEAWDLQDEEPGASTGPTAGQPPADSAPPQAEPTQAEPAETEPVDPEPAEPPSASATAQNQSQTWQAISQVQQGCRSHCQGTSQSQSADQYAETIQNATAIGGGTGTPSSATAVNQSTTGQFIRQVQLGCVAFCYETSRTQAAKQWAQTTQNATALADGNAQAHNAGSVVQEVWQLQVGCETECYGTSQTATWRRLSGHGRSEARLRRSSSATALSGPGGGRTTHTRVESSARVEAGSSSAKTHTSATTTTGSGTSSADFPPISDKPPTGLEKPPGRGFSTADWILISLLLAGGVAMLRKTHLRRPVT
jgi:hypothetical protein